MADNFQAFGILLGHHGQRGVAIDAKARVDHAGGIALADSSGEGRLGQAATDGLCHFGHRHRAGILAPRTVGQLDRDHESSERQTKKRGTSRAS